MEAIRTAAQRPSGYNWMARMNNKWVGRVAGSDAELSYCCVWMRCRRGGAIRVHVWTGERTQVSEEAPDS